MRMVTKTILCCLLAGCHAERPISAVSDEPTLAILGPDGVICAAVAITASLAVTANHCVPDRDVTFVTASRNGQADRTASGLVVNREVNSDLAVFSATGLVPATLAPGELDFEHTTTLVTHVPAPWSTTTRRPHEAREGFLLTPRLESGMSGSGLWDDGGRLVGIAVGNDTVAGYFAGRERIRKLLERVPAAPRQESIVELPGDTRAPALWGDASYSVDELVASTRRHRRHLQNGIDELERTR
jgi:hypothetical protein